MYRAVRLNALAGTLGVLVLGASACTAPAAAPTAPAPPTPTVAPASPAKPTAAPAVSASPSPAVKPAASPAAAASPSPATAGRLRVISPKDGDKITSTDIPVEVEVSNFKLAVDRVGMPDRPDEGHVHVMHDGMNMGVLFNFYTTPKFTLLGQGLKPGPHTLTFDLATNTHEDIESTVQQVNIDYQPTTPKPAPAPSPASGKPEVKVTEPKDGATVGPKFQIKVQPTNFTPSEGMEGKQNLPGIGHYHLFVDMDMSSMNQPGVMMSMAGLVLMPGTNIVDVDLSGWKNGKHTVTVEPVQNDHTPIEGAQPALFTITLTGASQ
jgi:hypothetical protein